jgi:YebC/PmpR family DNA-binding regulatory protein
MTDNKNRTVASIRHAFSRGNGNLGTDGSVAYLFDKKGVISFVSDVDEDDLMDPALEAGADDVVTNDDGSVDVFTTPNDFGAVKDALDAAGFVSDHAEVTMVAATKADLDKKTAPQLLRLIDALEDDDDVQEVYHNAEISDEVAATL